MFAIMADSHLPPSGAGPASPSTNRPISVLDFAQSSQAKTSPSSSTSTSKPEEGPLKKKKKEHATGVGTSNDRSEMPESTLNMQALQERGCYTVDIKGDGMFWHDWLVPLREVKVNWMIA